MICYFCDGSLGTNQVLRASSVGSHIIFSAERARLWIACERCGRWNLPDVAIAEALLAECRRRFRAETGALTLGGVGQAEIGKLRLTRVDSTNADSSLVLRHTGRIERRSRKNMILGSGAAMSGMMLHVGLQTLGGAPGPAVGVLTSMAALVAINRLQRRRRLILPLPSGEELVLTRAHATRAALISASDGWALTLPTLAGTRTLAGPDALAALARLLPLFGGVVNEETVAAAVRMVQAAPGVDAMIVPMTGPHTGAELAKWRRWSFFTEPWTIWALSPAQRLALEMVATEQHERDVLQLEVAELTLRLHEAAEIADIIEEEFPL